MKVAEGTLEVGHTMPLADYLASFKNIPIRILTEDDLQKEFEFYEKYFHSTNDK